MVVVVTVSFLLPTPLSASILGAVRGLIHDPQHRPVSGAVVQLHAVSSDFSQTTTSNDAGEFVFENIPIGEYSVEVQLSGFQRRATKIGAEFKP